MFCFILMTLQLAGCTFAIPYANPEKYTLISLPALCAKSHTDHSQSLDSDGPRAAILMSLGEIADNNIQLRTSNICKIKFIAPERHMIAVSYLHGDEEYDLDSQNISCPLNMTVRNGVVGFRPNLCEHQGTSSIPSLYPRRLELEVETAMDIGWPQTNHRLMITSIGSESSVCLVKQNQFPCDWEQDYNKKWRGLIPKLCVSKHLACDGIINCPLSGADETKALCSTDGVLSPETKTRPHMGKGLTSLIHEAAERAAANLAIHGRHVPGVNISSIFTNNAAKDVKKNFTIEKVEESYLSAPSIIYCLYIFCAVVFLCLLFCWYKICQHVSRKYRLGQTQETVEHQTRNTLEEEEMELRCTPVESSVSAASASSTSTEPFDCSLPPDYSTLFPLNKAS